MSQTPITYKDAGVDIEAGNALVERIKSATQRTRRPEVLGNLGGFGSMVTLPKGYHNPVLVSGTDGVGTKLKLAMQLNRHEHIGIDLVAMCVNDLLVCGAEPLYFLDYYATGQLSIDLAAQVIEGIAEGCHQANCSLVGGETAEMPGMYEGNDYDLAGFCTGVVEHSKILDHSQVKREDKILGLASTGPHSNGYSLIRKLLEISKADLEQPIGDVSLADALMAPTRIYVKSLLPLAQEGALHAMAHITGGGLYENIPRVLPDELAAHIDLSNYELPPVFKWLQQAGNMEARELLTTFNCGIGMIIIVPENGAASTIEQLELAGETVFELGTIQEKGKDGESIVVDGLAF